MGKDIEYSVCKNCDREVNGVRKETGFCDDCHGAYDKGYKRGLKANTPSKPVKGRSKKK